MSKELPTYISHSAAQTFKSCHYKYHLKYVERIAPKEQGASLAFGSAIDEAIGYLLTMHQQGKVEEGVANFKHLFLNNPIKGWMLSENNRDLRYGKRDYDASVLQDAASIQQIETWQDELKTTAEAAMQAIKQEKYKEVKDYDFEMYNRLSWLSLKNKGLLMLDGFARDILPKITQVIAVQHKFEGETGHGGIITGFIDLLCMYEGYDKPVVIDIKTAAMAYEEDSVMLSEQLSLYLSAVGESLETDTAGFAIMLKAMDKKAECGKCGNVKESSHKTCNAMIKKVVDVNTDPSKTKEERCNGQWIETPEAKTQVVIDEIPKAKRDDYLSGFSDLTKYIRVLKDKNYSSCKDFGLCDYFYYCHGTDEQRKDKYFKKEAKK